MSASRRLAAAFSLLLAQVAFVPPGVAAELDLPRDGWASWQVAAPEGSPAWCCFDRWQNGVGTQTVCKLDEEHSGGFGAHRDTETTDAVRVYARVAGGKVDRLQVLSASCPVETRTAIQNVAGVAVDDSARWLITQAKPRGADADLRHSIVEGALAALALHQGDVAGNALAEFARRDARADIRQRAVFWLALLRGARGAEVTSVVMFGDPDAEVRRHAAFAMSQSKSARAVPDLIRLGNTDPSAEVRGHAWFSLALTGAEGAEQAISSALRKDADDQVREQAVFALSRLPEERATRALIAAAQDASLPREPRRRAVFWLAQSDAPSAQAYLEKVLTP